MKFVNNCRVCSSHAGNQGNHCCRQERSDFTNSGKIADFTAYKLQLCLTGTQVYTCITMSSSAVLLLASYRGFIAQRKVGLHSFKRFSSLLVEFSVSFRVADFAVVEQMPMCQRLQMVKADDASRQRRSQPWSQQRQAR